MTDWLVVLPEDNWEVCAHEGLLGLGGKADTRLERMADGDRIWIYINKERTDPPIRWIRRIRASAIVHGPVRRLTTVPWHHRGIESFAFARGISPDREFDIPGPEVIKTLSFVRDPTTWGTYLLNTPVRLATGDAGKLEEAIRHSRSIR